MVVRYEEASLSPGDPVYAGLRIDADAYLALPDDGYKYELVDGIVLMSPGANFSHNKIAGLIEHWIQSFLDSNPLGEVVRETDVRLAADLVYRPDVAYVCAEREAIIGASIEGPPDLIVEVVSPRNRLLDLRTKRSDYERFGVREYWIVDPARKSFTFLRLVDGRYLEIEPVGDAFATEVIPGFKLNLSLIRKRFERQP